MMMKKVHGLWFIVHGVLFFLALYAIRYTLYATCYAQPISSTELINNAKQYDDKAVVYKGEVIGDVMRRGNYAWINVNDGENAIGIWLPVNLTKEIAYTGSYKSIGDEIEITGVFHRACLEHAGDLDIHAQVMRKIDSGRLIQDKLNTSKRNQTIVLLGILALVWILTLFKHK